MLSGLLLSAVLVAQPRLFAADDPVLASYLGLLDKYQQGQFGEALRELAGWSPRRLGLARATLEKKGKEERLKPQPDAEKLRSIHLYFHAAAVLYTDFGLAQGRHSSYLEFARDSIASIYDPTLHRHVMREWLILVASYHQMAVDETEARRYFEEALRLFPDDAEVLLRIGAFHEGMGFLTRDESRVEEAEGYYRRALLADSELVEAHLRRGRVLHRSGNVEAAETELAWTLAHALDPQTRHLAFLFEGDLLETTNRWTDAAESFRAAIALEPDCQAAYLALAHAARRAGDRSAARGAVEIALRRKTGRLDDWWLYLVGPAGSWEVLLDQMRRDIR